jgi:hypothetical protein
LVLSPSFTAARNIIKGINMHQPTGCFWNNSKQICCHLFFGETSESCYRFLTIRRSIFQLSSILLFLVQALGKRDVPDEKDKSDLQMSIDTHSMISIGKLPLSHRLFQRIKASSGEVKGE